MTNTELLHRAVVNLRLDAEYENPINPEFLTAVADWLYRAAQCDLHESDPAYLGLPDHRWCLICEQEECDGMRLHDSALAVARAYVGGGEAS